jgi:SulP family sulfate permease
LTLAVEAGLVASAFVFMFRMADAVEISAKRSDSEEDDPEAGASDDANQRARLPQGVEVFQVTGPLFFGTANRVEALLDHLISPPRALILRVDLVPLVDATGAHALKTLVARCDKKSIVLIISGLQAQPARVLREMGLAQHEGALRLVPDYEAALATAAELTAAPSLAGASVAH